MAVAEEYDLTEARLGILGEFRSTALLYLGFGVGALVVAAAVGAGAYAGVLPSYGPVLIGLSILLVLMALVWLFAAVNLLRGAPSKLAITSDGLRLEFPSGRAKTVSWRGRPRPFGSELVVCDLWERTPAQGSVRAGRTEAVVAMCPPYPRKTRLYPSVGLSHDALRGILRAASARGLRVTKEATVGSRVSGFQSIYPGETMHYVVLPHVAPDRSS